MSELARLPFGSPGRSAEQGDLVLDDNGSVRIEPSEDLRDSLAEVEEKALAAAKKYGTRPGLVLLALGFAAVAAGWYAGRVLGKFTSVLLAPIPVSKVRLTRNADGCLVVTRGKTTWTAGQCSAAEIKEFSRKLKEIQDDL